MSTAESRQASPPPAYVKVAADRRGDVIALVERRGGRPAYEATVHVWDGKTFERLACFDGPQLMHLRIAVAGDRVVVGDWATGRIVGFDLRGAVAWGAIAVAPEVLDSLTPSLDGESIYARVSSPRRVLCLDPRAGVFAPEATAVFANLPQGIGKMPSACCIADGIVLAAGWAEDASAAVARTPRAARLFGLVVGDGAMRVLWQRDGHFLDLAASSNGAVGLVSNDGIDERAREKTPLFASSTLVRIDSMTGAEPARVDLGAALADSRDACLFASGTRLVATDGTVRDTANGSVIGRIG